MVKWGLSPRSTFKPAEQVFQISFYGDQKKDRLQRGSYQPRIETAQKLIAKAGPDAAGQI